MTSKIIYRIRDNSDEYSSFEYEVEDATAASFDTLFTGAGSVKGTMQTVLEGILLGNIASIKVILPNEVVNDVRPASRFAQVENAITVYGQDANGKLHTRSIPCPDLDAILTDGTDELNLTQAPFSAVVTALNDSWRPNGQDVTVIKAVYNGRKS
jgi:hypothetical protein